MRCLALSEELIKRKHQVYIFSKIQNQELIKKIKDNNIVIKQINKDLSIDEDLKQLIDYIKKEEIDWVITDHYNINENYIKTIKENNFKVLSVDDTAKMHYYSDVVLNQNIGSEKLSYSSEKYTKLLLGSKYVMLRDEIIKEKNKEFNTAHNVLITFGGTDNNNFTLKILKILNSRFNELKYLVITGPLNPFYKEIEKYSNNHQNVSVFKSPENMAEIYLKSDIAISAGGSSCYELAYNGIPNLIITIAKNQEGIAEDLEKNNISINLGTMEKIDEKILLDNVKRLLSDDQLRKQMSENGKQLVDGKGKGRIVDYLERFN